MFRYTIAFLLAGISFVALHAQTLQVKDAATRQPLANATITATANGRSVATNSRGEADISSLSGGDSLTIMYAGYASITMAISDLSASGDAVYLTEKSVLLDDVVIAASRFEEKHADVAQQVTVITSNDLNFMNQPTSAEVMSQSGQVMVQKSQLGGGSPVMRGFEANRVLMVIDGVRMNNLIYRGGHLQNIISVDNNMLDRVEMVFGPGSVVYGSDALGGVMHFQTKRPMLADSGSTGMLVKGGAFMRFATAAEEKTGHLDLNLGWKKFASLTSFTYTDFNDLRQGNARNPFYGDWGKVNLYAQRFDDKDSSMTNPDPNVQIATGYSQYDVLQKFLFRQNSRVSHILNVQFSNSSHVPRFDRLSLISGGKPRFAEWYYGPQKRLFAAYSAEMNPENGWMDKGRITLAFQDIEESRQDRRFGSVFLNSRVEKVKVITLNGDFEKRINKQEFRYGFEVADNLLSSTATQTDIVQDTVTKLDTRYPDGSNNQFSTALYGTHSWEISEKLILQDGLRASFVNLNSQWNDTTFFPFPFSEVTQSHLALNGNLGLVLKPGAGWRVSVLGSTGFRAPNVDDLGKVFESTPGNIVVPNPDLSPEYVWNGELSVGKSWQDKVHASVTAWYSLYQNAITTQKGSFNGADSVLYTGVLSQVTMNTNAGQAYIYGGSAVLAADFDEHFSFNTTVTYTYGRIQTDTVPYPLDHIPPIFGRTGITLKLKKFRTEFFALYQGWKRLRDYNVIGEDNLSYATPYGTPAWMTLNVRASWQVHQHLSVQASLENILDQNYRVFASGLSAPGRNFMITLRSNF